MSFWALAGCSAVPRAGLVPFLTLHCPSCQFSTSHRPTLEPPETRISRTSASSERVRVLGQVAESVPVGAGRATEVQRVLSFFLKKASFIKFSCGVQCRSTHIHSLVSPRFSVLFPPCLEPPSSALPVPYTASNSPLRAECPSCAAEQVGHPPVHPGAPSSPSCLLAPLPASSNG